MASLRSKGRLRSKPSRSRRSSGASGGKDCIGSGRGKTLGSATVATTSLRGRAGALEKCKRDKRILDLQNYEENLSKVEQFCYQEKNFKLPGCRQLNSSY
jgi:hypothetical protein